MTISPLSDWLTYAPVPGDRITVSSTGLIGSLTMACKRVAGDRQAEARECREHRAVSGGRDADPVGPDRAARGWSRRDPAALLLESRTSQFWMMSTPSADAARA